MAVRYALFYFFFLLVVLICKIYICTLLKFSHLLQLFGAQGPAPHSVSLWIKRIKVKSHTNAIYFAFLTLFYLFSVL